MNKKIKTILAIAIMTLGVLIMIYGYAFAGWFTSEPVTCHEDSRGTLTQLQKACAEEIQHNKQTRQELHDRNDEIRKLMGWSDEDIVKLGLSKTTATAQTGAKK